MSSAVYRVDMQKLNSSGSTSLGFMDGWTSAQLVWQLNNVGTADIELPVSSQPWFLDAITLGNGIIVTRDGIGWWNGILTKVSHKYIATPDGIKNGVALHYESVETLIARRLAHPQPLTYAPPYATNAYDVIGPNPVATVVKSLIDRNMTSGVAPTQRASILSTSSDGSGASVTARARWQNLLAYVREVIAMDTTATRPVRVLGFLSSMGFTIGTGRDRTETSSAVTDRVQRLSVKNQTLRGYDSELNLGDENNDYGGGSGSGSARVIVASDGLANAYSASTSQWLRFEKFLDRQDLTTVGDLQAALTARLATTATVDARYGWTVDVSERPANAGAAWPFFSGIQTGTFGAFTLGDLITVEIDGDVQSAVVQGATALLKPGNDYRTTIELARVRSRQPKVLGLETRMSTVINQLQRV